MASSYNRQINFYIVGKQVSNDLKSIRAEMARFVNEQARMTYWQRCIHPAASGHDCRTQPAILGISRSWSLPGVDEFNRYYSMIQAARVAIVGLVLGFKSLVKVFYDYEEWVDNLLALTGLWVKAFNGSQTGLKN